MALLPDDWWACFHDIDTLFLTPECGRILQGYAERYPEAGILTCLTNRVSDLSSKQMLNGKRSEDSDIRNHITIAKIQERHLWETTPIDRDISGMLMLISKRTWNDMKFQEGGKCLGVDTTYGRKIRAAGKKILRCDGLYVWHTYRLLTGIYDKKHLI